MSAPYFTTVGIYGVLDLMYAVIDQVRLPFRPKRWADICMTIALLSLILQVIGGSLAHKASSAASSLDKTVSLGIDILQRLVWRMPMLKMLAVLAFALVCIIVRDTYRIVESTNGWRGYSYTYEILGCLLDGLPMFIANVTLSIWHPAVLLNEAMLMESGVVRAEEVELRSREDQNGRGGSRLLDEYPPISEELEPVLRKR
ncbi:hypothetical protein AnigIFM60653_004116 [Aspergillus niger]|nr:hypothetical protein AnigIFM60653_004116 [Aspergillus niger]